VRKRSLVLLVASVLIIAGTSVSACGSKSVDSEEPAVQQEQPVAEQTATAGNDTESASDEAAQQVTELQVKDVVVGKGAVAKTGDNVTVNYTLWLTDGTKIESSKDSGQPFSFDLGAGDVIPGWDQGIPGMKVGGTRRLTIPSDLAYGPQGAGAIPPNATLVFEVELLSIN
jgi:FKBP-type peptidyl-prolyl cis-trans isomerase FkpA